MGTKNVTTTTNQYAPAGMQTYNALQGPATNVMSGNISDPYGNTFFQGQQYAGGQANRGFGSSAAGANRQATSALGTPRGSGWDSASSAWQRQSNLTSDARMNNALLLGAAQNRQTSLGNAMSYRPLQTGGKQVQSTSGLGTWLPQVAGMALAAATGGMSGGKPIGGPKGPPSSSPFMSNAGYQNWLGGGDSSTPQSGDMSNEGYQNWFGGQG